jgi:hypothetical protein
MFKKLTSPYRFLPAYIRIDRIDRLIAMGATAEIHDPGRKGLKNQIIVTFRDPRGEIADQIMVTGNGF